MDSKYFVKMMLVFALLLAVLSGCPAPAWVAKEPPVPLGQFMSSKWGDSVEEVKRAIAIDGKKWFQDSTEEPSHALYAFGTYLDHPAIFSYFFTPKSKKLYRVDVTFSDLRIYEKAKNFLVEEFKEPSHSQPDVAYWSWNDKSLIILQKNKTDVQVSYSSGPLLIQNQPIRLPGLKPGVCSGLILSGAFCPDLKIGVWRHRTYQEEEGLPKK